MAWAKEELHLGKSPSHSAFYRWMGTLRKVESEQRIEEMAIAVADADALGKKLPTDKKLIATFKTPISFLTESQYSIFSHCKQCVALQIKYVGIKSRMSSVDMRRAILLVLPRLNILILHLRPTFHKNRDTAQIHLLRYVD